MRIRFLRRAASPAILALSLCGVLPHAATAEDAIVVTATRFPDDVAKLPASVTVITEDEIARSAARTLPELLAGEAGIGTRDFFGNNASSTTIDMRGYGAAAAQNTLILVDGRRLNDFDLSGVQWSSIPLSSIARIEIVRGSGAVLHGDGASAGVINIVTRSPLRQDRRFEASGRVATFNTSEGQLYGSIASGSFGLNASVYGFSSDGFRGNNRNEQRNHALNARWALGNSVLDLRVGDDRQDVRLPGARRIQASSGLDELTSNPRGAQTPKDYSSRDGQRASMGLVHRFGEAELSLGLDWRTKDQRSYFDQSGFPLYRADALDFGSFWPRLRVPFALGGMQHRLTIGAEFGNWRYHSRRTTVPENIARPITRVNVDQTTRAFYLQDVIELTDRTRLTAGLRAERARYSATDTLDTGAPGFSAAANSLAPAAGDRQRQHAWELGLRHSIDARWAAFARAGRSFRFVNADELYESDTAFKAQFQILRPQHALTHEAGAEWQSRIARGRVTVFRTIVTDEIHLDPFSTGVGNSNFPPLRRLGLELDGHWQPSPAWRIGANWTFVDARFLEGVLPGSGTAIGRNLDLAGRRVPLVPAQKLNLSSSWSPRSGTRISGLVTMVSRQVMDNDEPNTLGTRIPGYVLVDLKAEQTFSWGRLGLAINNVFDQSYFNYAVRSAFTKDRYAVYPLPGRTIGVTGEIRLD
ncbi:MAG: TonB-dependent receptor [Proteobacteria bacterium]|nr:TonB-dependent receptor [Pseudomonadota bacterium]